MESFVSRTDGSHRIWFSGLGAGNVNVQLTVEGKGANPVQITIP